MTIRRIIREELEQGGYETIEAENGIKALLRAIEGTPPDLITLDIDMPVMDGFKTCQRLREEKYSKFFEHHENLRVPIIFVTAHDNLGDRKKGFDMGATEFITKPFIKGEILAAVNNILKPDTSLKDLTALVVDDSSVARGIIVSALERAGVKAIPAENGVEAFEVMCKQMSEIDMLITDLMMPEMNGDELCRKIRKELNLHDLPIIFLTGMSEKLGLLDLFKAGGTDYIVKPFIGEELLARLNVHLERANLNKRLRKSVVELRSLNKMKDELLSVCSHDLRTPLNGILGFTEIMLDREDLSKEEKHGLSEIKASGEVLLDLINDILDLSKIQSDGAELEKIPIRVSELAQSSFGAMKYMAARKDQTIDLIKGSHDDMFLGNRAGMIRVINNLLSNAIKFTPKKGKIRLMVEPGPKEHLRITVKDSGIGIPKDKIPHIFDKFTKTSQSGTGGERGTGLGMSIVKEMVEKHNGRIEVSSKVGKGTRFDLIIPLTMEIPEEETVITGKGDISPKADRKVAGLKKGYKILLADDNTVNLEVAKRMLVKEGHMVTEVEDGYKALLAANSEEFDLILMDMQMPEMDGLEATRALRSRGLSEVPIIALTANTGQENIDACFKAGMNDFLSKPFRPNDIRAKITKWLDR